MTPNLPQNLLNGKHVVVFGAGYVGGAVADHALAAGARVTALTRNGETGDRLRAMGCEVVTAELASEAWHDQITSPDFVLNSVSSGRRGLEGYRNSYAKGAQSISNWGRRLRCSPAPLIYTSSTSVYPQDGGVEVDESMPAKPHDDRAAILLQAEQLAGEWVGPTTVLRLAGIYGPGRHHLLDQLRTGVAELSGSATHHLNLIHRDDVVRAVMLRWLHHHHQSAHSVFNVADDGRATRAEIVAWLSNELGRAVPSFSGAPVAGRRAVSRDRIVLNHKLKSGLGWQPRYPTYREGYADLLLGA